MIKNQNKLLCNIKKLRELRGYDQKYLAGQLGLQQNTYSKIENGQIRLTIERVSEIANILGTTINVLNNFDEGRVFDLFDSVQKGLDQQKPALHNIIKVLFKVFQQLTEQNTDRIKILEEKIKSLEETLAEVRLK